MTSESLQLLCISKYILDITPHPLIFQFHCIAYKRELNEH